MIEEILNRLVSGSFPFNTCFSFATITISGLGTIRHVQSPYCFWHCIFVSSCSDSAWCMEGYLWKAFLYQVASNDITMHGNDGETHEYISMN